MIFSGFSGLKVLESGFTYIDSNKIVKDIIELYTFKSPYQKEKLNLRVDLNSFFIFKGIEADFYNIIFSIVKRSFEINKKLSNLNIESRNSKISGASLIAKTQNPNLDKNINYNVISLFIELPKYNKDLADFKVNDDSYKKAMINFDGDFDYEVKDGKWIKFNFYFPELGEAENIKARNLISIQSKNISDSQDETNLNKSKFLKRVLIADDEIINLKIISKFIISYAPNTKIDIVKDGDEALNIIKSCNSQNNYYDLIITDIQMPNMDGFEFAEKLRKIDKITPIVAYTSRTSYKIKQKALDFGINEYVVKPIPNLRLLRIIFKWLVQDRFCDANDSKIRKNLKGLRALIVDDEPVNLILLKRVLENYDIIVDVASDGQELVNLYKNQFKGTILEEYDKNHNPHYQDPNLVNKYDIILTDILMPNKNGDLAVKEIRDFELVYNIQNLAIIMGFSADSEIRKIKSMLKIGFDDYFAKGSSNSDLIKKIYFWIANLKDQKDLSYLNIYNKEHKIEDARKNSRLINDKLSKNELIEFRSLFVESVEGLIEKIKKSQIENNIKDLAFHSHALKGISGNIGAEKLFLYISMINNHARRDLWPENNNWFQELEEIALKTINKIKEY